MRHQKVRDIITADPVTVTSATTLKYVAEFLVKQKRDDSPLTRGTHPPVSTPADLATDGGVGRDNLRSAALAR